MSSIPVYISWSSADAADLCPDGDKVGSNATTVKSQTVNHLNSYSRLLSGIPLRVRIGGRSSENYTYAEVFASGPGGEPKPSDGTGVFGPTVVGVLQTLSKRLGVTYLLSEPNLLIVRDRFDHPSRFEFEGA